MSIFLLFSNLNVESNPKIFAVSFKASYADWTFLLDFLIVAPSLGNRSEAYFNFKSLSK